MTINVKGFPTLLGSVFLFLYAVFSFRKAHPSRVCGLSVVRLAGMIAQMKEFFDTGHIHAHVEEHESKTKWGEVMSTRSVRQLAGFFQTTSVTDVVVIQH